MSEKTGPQPSAIRSNEDDLKFVKRITNWIWPKTSLWRRSLRILIVLILLPYLLMFVYWPSFVHPLSTLMMGDLITFHGYDRRWIKLENVSPVLVQSVMMSEDGRFCSHYGIDFVQMRGVIDDALSGEKTRGASTITMQTARNLFLWNGRSFIRKALELPLALSLDFVWSKPRIMEVYLNIAEWGPHIYGIDAAAHHYFKTSATKLSAHQAALLAAALPNPYVRIPNKPTRGMKAIANLIARRAANSGDYIRCIFP